MPTPIALILLREASSGTGPTTTADTAASPQDLPISYSGGSAWTSNAYGRALDSKDVLSYALVDPWAKIGDVDGLQAVTMETALTVVTASIDASPNAIGPIGISGSQFLGLDYFAKNAAYGWAFGWNTAADGQQEPFSGVVSPLGYHVAAAVMDTTLASGRLKIYVDGQQVFQTDTNLTQGTTIAVSGATEFYVAFGHIDIEAPVGFGGVYGSAFSAATALAHALRLFGSNDFDPDNPGANLLGTQGNGGTAGASASSSDSTADISITIGARGDRRAVAFLVTTSTVATVGVTSATIDGRPMRFFNRKVGGGADGGSELWYALDSDLPDAAGTYSGTVTVASGTLCVTPVYLDGAKQSAPRSGGTAYGAGTSLTVALDTELLGVGSIILGALYDGEITDVPTLGNNQLRLGPGVLRGTGSGDNQAQDPGAKYYKPGAGMSLGWGGLAGGSTLVALAAEFAATVGVGAHTAKQSAAAPGNTSITTDAIDTTTNGSSFVVFVNYTGATPPAVTDNKGNTYRQVGAAVDFPTPAAPAAMFYCEDAQGGIGHTFTTSFGVNTLCGMWVVEVVGGRLFGLIDRQPAGQGTSTQPFLSPSSGTTRQEDELVLAFTATGTTIIGTEKITWGNGFYPLDALSNTLSVTGGTAYLVSRGEQSYQSSLVSQDGGTSEAICFIATFRAGVGQSVCSTGASAQLDTSVDFLNGAWSIGTFARLRASASGFNPQLFSVGTGVSILGLCDDGNGGFLVYSNGGASTLTLTWQQRHDWLWVGMTHAAASGSITVYWGSPGDPLQTATLPIGTPTGRVHIFTDDFGEDAINAELRSFFIKASAMSAAEMLAASRTLDAPPGTNKVFLPLETSATWAKNLGTDGDFTPNATPLSLAEEPEFRPGGAIALAQPPFEVAFHGDGENQTIHTGTNFTAGNTVFFILSSYPSRAAAVTINGVAAVLDRSLSRGGNDFAQIWRAANVPGGSDVVATGLGAQYITGCIIEATGTLGIDRIVSATGDGNAPAPGDTGALTVPNELAITNWSNSNTAGGSYNAPFGYTVAYSGRGVDEGGAGAFGIVESSADLNPVWASADSVGWAAIAATYFEEAGVVFASSANTGSGTHDTVTRPTGYGTTWGSWATFKSYIVAYVYYYDSLGAACTPPAGFVSVAKRTVDTGSVSLLEVFIKKATGSEPSSYTFTTGQYTGIEMLVYNNVDGTTPVTSFGADDAVSAGDQANSHFPPLSSVRDGSYYVLGRLGFGSQLTGGDPPTPAGLTQRDVFDLVNYGYDRNVPVVGTVSPPTTANTANDAWVTIAIMLQPALDTPSPAAGVPVTGPGMDPLFLAMNF